MFKRPKNKLGVLQREITYIDGFPRWGCYVACILTCMQRCLGRRLFAHEVQQWYCRCTQDGHIRHNDLPIKKGTEWYRCYVNNYIAAFNLGMEMFKGKRQAAAASSHHPANVRFYRWKTPLGWHFTYGNPEREIHDPDPNLKLLRRDGQRDMYIMEVKA